MQRLFLTLLFILPITLNAQSVASTSTATTTRFVVPLNATQTDVVQSLYNQKYINNLSDINFIISPGAYKLSTTTFTTAKNIQILKSTPYMKWVVIPPGLRKEEVANILATNLNWTAKQKKNFLAYTNENYNYIEGVYFPNTYLIPLTDTPKDVYKRIIAKFNENFSSLQPQFAKQNFPWIKGLTLASIVEREAANKEDMPLIAGILLNRLNQKIPLSVDATLQYIRGDKNANIKNATATAYWAPITVADKKADSKYNTYRNTGLPPHPISNPSLDAINAVLNPASTSCIYYLHKNKITYCTNTYAEHLQNIETYLKATTTPTTNQ